MSETVWPVLIYNTAMTRIIIYEVLLTIKAIYLPWICDPYGGLMGQLWMFGVLRRKLSETYLLGLDSSTNIYPYMWQAFLPIPYYHVMGFLLLDVELSITGWCDRGNSITVMIVGLLVCPAIDKSSIEKHIYPWSDVSKWVRRSCLPWLWNSIRTLLWLLAIP